MKARCPLTELGIRDLETSHFDTQVSASFNISTFCILPTKFMRGFCMVFKINNSYSPT
jgi:hypothetical protein